MYPKPRIALTIALAIALAGCTWFGAKTKEDDLVRVKSKGNADSKKVIMLMADSLLVQALDRGIKNNELPAFKYLIEHGQYYKDVVSSFPTMSVTIDSTLLTGTHPDRHHVPGLIWYDAEEKRLVNYGTGTMESWRHGADKVLQDALVRLNQSHLNPHVRTVFEELARYGLTSGSVNGLIYRGNTEHTLTIPPWIQVPVSAPKQLKVKGPDFFAFGLFANPLEGEVRLPDGLTNKLGFTNEYALRTVKHLIRTGRLPDFLYVYLPDMDQRLHRYGPDDAEGIRRLDGQLASLLQAFGSADEALKQAVIIVTGDSGVAPLLPSSRKPVVELSSLLNAYNVLKPGDSVGPATDIVLAVNETMAYVYKLKSNPSLHQLAVLFASEPRIDLIAWKEGGWIHVMRNGVTGRFLYKAGGPVKDDYGQTWTLNGSTDVLDLHLSGGNRLAYGRYPDALARLSGALHSHKGDFLAITAKPGFELADQSSPTHEGGGGHGSLHRTESVVPVIVGGTNAELTRHRIVDLKQYVIRLLTKKR